VSAGIFSGVEGATKNTENSKTKNSNIKPVSGGRGNGKNTEK